MYLLMVFIVVGIGGFLLILSICINCLKLFWGIVDILLLDVDKFYFLYDYVFFNIYFGFL